MTVGCAAFVRCCRCEILENKILQDEKYREEVQDNERQYKQKMKVIGHIIAEQMSGFIGKQQFFLGGMYVLE